MLARHFAFTMNGLLNTFVYTVCDERYRSSWNFKPRVSVFLIGLEVSWTFCLPLLLRCSSLSFFVNTGKLSRDLHHVKSFEVFTAGFSALSAIFDSCPPEPRFHDFARVIVTNAGKVYWHLCKQGIRWLRDYQPMSALPLVSKIFEKIVYRQLALWLSSG